MSEAADEATTDVEQEIADAMGDDEEAETDDEIDALHSPEGELVAAAPAGPSPQEMEKGFKTVERASTAYAQKVGQAFPEGAMNLAPCPLCSTRIPAFVDLEFAGAIPDDVKGLTMQYLGFAREQSYKDDPELDVCSGCDGDGFTATGSKVPGNEKRKCPRCRGFGYYPPPGAGAVESPEPGPIHAAAGEQSVALVAEDVDPSGEPKILPDGRVNPNFGKWPQFKVNVEPWGKTAGLTAQDVVV